MALMTVFTNTIILKYLIASLLNQKYTFLSKLFNDIDQFSKLKPWKKKYNTASELYDDFLKTYFDEYYYLSDTKRNKIDSEWSC